MMISNLSLYCININAEHFPQNKQLVLQHYAKSHSPKYVKRRNGQQKDEISVKWRAYARTEIVFVACFDTKHDIICSVLFGIFTYRRSYVFVFGATGNNFKF